jgi:hypothetical protein
MVFRERNCAGHHDWQIRHDRDDAVRGARPEHQVVRALMDQRPQGVVDRRADDVGSRKPDVPPAVANQDGQRQLRYHEQHDPDRRRPRVACKRAQLGVRSEQLAAAA